jgi:peptidyl-prolyl cis-trans isomerase A (cyclophilin A)
VKNKNLISTLVFSLSCLLVSCAANATVVEVRTNVGNFQINLFDNATPRTVENFLSYVNAGAYANNTVHRSADNFVIQMGGFQYNNDFPPDPIATGTAVINEPELSNLRATVAMAKLGNNPNSATSQFFVSLSNNSGSPSNLDTQNGGFTVFGQVLGNGMEIVDQIAGLPKFGFAAPFNALPLRDYTSADASNNITPTDENLVIISDIVVIDAAVSTNPELNPTLNTRINSGGQQPTDDGGSGGSLGIMLVIGLAVLTAVRRRVFAKRNQ